MADQGLFRRGLGKIMVATLDLVTIISVAIWMCKNENVASSIKMNIDIV